MGSKFVLHDLALVSQGDQSLHLFTIIQELFTLAWFPVLACESCSNGMDAHA